MNYLCFMKNKKTFLNTILGLFCMLFAGRFFYNFLHFTGVKKYNILLINILHKNSFPVILIFTLLFSLLMLLLSPDIFDSFCPCFSLLKAYRLSFTFHRFIPYLCIH
jgi:hypothetical protein